MLLQELSKRGSKENFSKSYDEACKLNTGNLAPMMEILHGITSNEDTLKYLNSKSLTADNVPTDLSSLKEKLLQQVGSKAFSGSKMICENWKPVEIFDLHTF